MKLSAGRKVVEMYSREVLAREMADPRLQRLPPLGRLLWFGVLANVDDQGRMIGQVEFVKSRVLPYDSVQPREVEDWLAYLSEVSKILIYAAAGVDYLQVIAYWQMASQQFARPSAFPAPAGWLDRIRYTPRRSQIVTFNWTTRDGKPVDDSCDVTGLPLTLPETMRPPAVQMSKPDELPPERTTPVQNGVMFADPRKFGDNGRVSALQGSTAVEVFYEIVSVREGSLAQSTMEIMNREIEDLSKWRQVVHEWRLRGYSAKNMKGMMDWYRNGIPAVKGKTNVQSQGERTQQRVAPSGSFGE